MDVTKTARWEKEKTKLTNFFLACRIFECTRSRLFLRRFRFDLDAFSSWSDFRITLPIIACEIQDPAGFASQSSAVLAESAAKNKRGIPPARADTDYLHVHYIHSRVRTSCVRVCGRGERVWVCVYLASRTSVRNNYGEISRLWRQPGEDRRCAAAGEGK